MIKRISTIVSFVCIFKASEGRASFKKGQSSQFTGALAKETKQKVQFGEKKQTLEIFANWEQTWRKVLFAKVQLRTAKYLWVLLKGKPGTFLK